MIHILSEYHAKRKDENGGHAKDAPHGTDEENHHRQNCRHGQNTTQKGTHETHRHIDHETARLDGLKNFRQNPQGAKRPCRFLGAPSVASHPEPGKVELLTG